MYENGTQVNGYRQKRLHKRKMKDRYANMWYWGSPGGSWDDMLIKYADTEREKWGHPLDYWKQYYLSGPRTIAKDRTNRTIRAHMRDKLAKVVAEGSDEIPSLKASDYRKYHDYDWTVW